MADAVDSKSTVLTDMSVRVRPRAPRTSIQGKPQKPTMRRLSAVLVSLLLTTAAFAGHTESVRRVNALVARIGRAMVLTPHQALSEADIADLASHGVSVGRALPGGRYIARVRNEVVAATDPRTASAEPMTSRMKL